jgi:hypothetical protein
MKTKKKELTVRVGDWVYNKKGRLIKIYADDMPELPYEDILRKATRKENPEFRFRLKSGANLNKENFWNPLMVKCPYAVGLFCEWIDEYKKKVNWNKLFNSDSDWQDMYGKNAPAPKFHDIPFSMQVGIIELFMRCYTKRRRMWLIKDNRGIANEFIDEFVIIEVKHRNRNKQ